MLVYQRVKDVKGWVILPYTDDSDASFWGTEKMIVRLSWSLAVWLGDCPDKLIRFQNWLVVWTIFLCFHILGIIIPTDELIFFRGVGIPPTRCRGIMAYQPLCWGFHPVRRMCHVHPGMMIPSPTSCTGSLIVSRNSHPPLLPKYWYLILQTHKCLLNLLCLIYFIRSTQLLVLALALSRISL